MIRFIDISHYAGERELFSGLSWHVKPGERVGLVGDNGTGKTTLLRMAVGEVEPVSGEVSARRNARIGFLRQEIHAATGETTVLQETMKAFEVEQQAQEEVHRLYDELTATQESEHAELLDRIHDLEKCVHHHDAGSAEADARKILAGLGFEIAQFDKPLSAFSGGWQMRAHIARLLLEGPDLLMLDEPTNHLDLESIAWLESFLTSFPGALIVVSHDRYFLDRITTRTAWITQKKMKTFTGNYSAFLKERELEEEMLLRRHKNQQDEIAHIQQFVDRFRAKATKAAAVQSRVKMLEKIELIELPTSAKKVRLRIPEPASCGRHAIELRDVGKAYGDNRVFRNVNLIVERGDKIALVGRNGAGKSTLLKICAGVLDHEGTRVLNSKVQLEYFSQHRIDMLNPDNSVLEEARPHGAAQSDEALRTLLGCFLFSGEDVFKPVHVLSGGEKSRLALARMMLRRGNVLLLDEPTNHLDISTRETLQQALREFPGTVMMISHDRYFIDSVANKIIEVADGKIHIHLGNYSAYLDRKDAGQDAQQDLRGRAAKAKAGAPASEAPKGKHAKGFHPSGALASIQLANFGNGQSQKNSAEDRKQKAQKRNALNSQIRSLQTRIEQMETRQAEIHALQCDPVAYAFGKITPAIINEAKTLDQLLPELLKPWEVLTEEAELAKAN